MKKIAIFASGSGSNAENIAKYFANNNKIKVDCILTNKAEAYVLNRAKDLNINTMVFNRAEFYETNSVLNYLKERSIDFIVLAGFLWLVPKNLTQNFSKKIINIHPALLPKYGGKGMYGMNVHRAVKESGDKESGISIHWVNERYDEGNIIFQARCPISASDTPVAIAEKVHALEYAHFPRIIEQILLS